MLQLLDNLIAETDDLSLTVSAAKNYGYVDLDQGTSVGSSRLLRRVKMRYPFLYGNQNHDVYSPSGSLTVGTDATTGKLNSYISATRQLTHNGNGGDLSLISDKNTAPVFFVKGTVNSRCRSHLRVIQQARSCNLRWMVTSVLGRLDPNALVHLTGFSQTGSTTAFKLENVTSNTKI